MSSGTHVSPSDRLWRIGTPVVFLLSGVLFVVSAQNSEGTDLRSTRYTDIASIVEGESDELNTLNARAAALEQEVADLASALDDPRVNRYNKQIERLRDPNGLTPVSGPAVTVILDDAPAEMISTTTRDVNDLVVHQQDIQAVANAMWRGGAEAITIMGRRIVSTTGIKCSGNTVQLQGEAFSPPYVITAVGDQVSILSELQDDSALVIYRDNADNPDIQVGWDLEVVDFATAPAYDGVLNVNYAVPKDS